MKEGSMYEYTNSAKNVRLFLVGEKCSEIIKSFTKFNFEHGVYQFFSEKLLEVAKSQYYIEFTEYDIKKFLTENGILENVPVFDNVEIEKDDYDKCEKLRVIGYKKRDCYSWVNPDYYWFTLWEIAKTYNKKHGCVVIEPPHRDMKWSSGELKLVLSWCKNANDAISGKLFIKKSKTDGIPAEYVFLAIFLMVISLILIIVGMVIIGLIPAICLLAITIIWLYYFAIKAQSKKESKEFKMHCEHISKTEYSRAVGFYIVGNIWFDKFSDCYNKNRTYWCN